MEGYIIVDGVLSSCYASVDHDLSQVGMKPLQLFPWMAKLIFGEDTGLQVFASIAGVLASTILPYEQCTMCLYFNIITNN